MRSVSQFPVIVDLLPEEEAVRVLEQQKADLERTRELALRRASAIQKAANLRQDIERLGGKPIK